MKSKISAGIPFGEKVNKTSAMNSLLGLQDFTIALYEDQNTGTELAHEETKRVIFSKEFSTLSGLTPAQWIARGGESSKAAEAIKMYINDAAKDIKKTEEKKTVVAKVFSGGR